MNILYLLLLGGKISFCASQGYFHMPCTVKEDEPMFTVLCHTYRVETWDPIILPNDINKNVEHLTLNLQFFKRAITITDENTFKQFPKLKSILISSYLSIAVAPFWNNTEKLKLLRKELFNVPTLRKFKWQLIGQYVYEGWILPDNVQEVAFLGTAPRCDLTECSQLYNFQCFDCALTTMPALHNPDPPLVTLNLTDNPLTNFTVNDVARFCLLKELSMRNTKFHNCECKRIEQWIKKLQQWGEFRFDGNLPCQTISGEECSNYTLDKAESLRKWCKWRITWSQYKVLIVILLVLSFVLVIVLVMGCIWLSTRRFRKRGGRNKYADYDYDSDNYDYYGDEDDDDEYS